MLVGAGWVFIAAAVCSPLSVPWHLLQHSQGFLSSPSARLHHVLPWLEVTVVLHTLPAGWGWAHSQVGVQPGNKQPSLNILNLQELGFGAWNEQSTLRTEPLWAGTGELCIYCGWWGEKMGCAHCQTPLPVLDWETQSGSCISTSNRDAASQFFPLRLCRSPVSSGNVSKFPPCSQNPNVIFTPNSPSSTCLLSTHCDSCAAFGWDTVNVLHSSWCRAVVLICTGNSIDNSGMFLPFLSSAYTGSRAFLLLTPPNQQGDCGGSTRSWERTEDRWPQMTQGIPQTERHHVPDIKLWEEE